MSYSSYSPHHPQVQGQVQGQVQAARAARPQSAAAVSRHVQTATHG